MLRLIVALCYGGGLLITMLSVVGLFVIERDHATVVGGWAFCTGLLFAIGRLAHLAQPAPHD